MGRGWLISLRRSRRYVCCTVGIYFGAKRFCFVGRGAPSYIICGARRLLGPSHTTNNSRDRIGDRLVASPGSPPSLSVHRLRGVVFVCASAGAESASERLLHEIIGEHRHEGSLLVVGGWGGHAHVEWELMRRSSATKAQRGHPMGSEARAGTLTASVAALDVLIVEGVWLCKVVQLAYLLREVRRGGEEEEEVRRRR